MKRKNSSPDGTGNSKAHLAGEGAILVVDDQEDLLQMVSRMLVESGFEVQTASNGLDAFRLFSSACFALVLTDFNMPGMDGLALAEKIKRASPDIPVIMMTGEVGQAVNKMEASACVTCLLRKPFGWNDLNDAVAAALEEGTVVSIQRLMPDPKEFISEKFVI